MKLEFLDILEKYRNVKFHDYPSSGERLVPCGRTERKTDMTELIVAFHSFAKASKDGSTYIHVLPADLNSLVFRF